MDIKEFITETVTGIIEATSELQSKYETQGVIINPPVTNQGDTIYQEASDVHAFRRIEVIEFDVAVTAGSETGAGGKVGLRILAAEASADGKRARRSEEVSRVRFSLPIVLSQSLAERQNRDNFDKRMRAQSAALAQRPVGSDWRSR